MYFFILSFYSYGSLLHANSLYDENVESILECITWFCRLCNCYKAILINLVMNVLYTYLINEIKTPFLQRSIQLDIPDYFIHFVHRKYKEH